MASYYYLVSSLPSLKTNGAMPFDYNTFLGMCKTAVSKDVYEKLEGLTLNSDNNPFLAKWAEFYQMLMGELNCLRKEKLGKPFVRSLDSNSTVRTVARNAMNAKTPLDAERILLDAQFDYLDSLVSMHYFDESVLFGYAVKLKLLERQNIFDFAKGSAEFKRLFDSVQEQIQNI